MVVHVTIDEPVPRGDLGGARRDHGVESVTFAAEVFAAPVSGHTGAVKGPTPAVVELTSAGVPFRVHDFADSSVDPMAGYGAQAAQALGVPADQVFKTLLVVADGEPAVAIVPVSGTLSMKRMAAALHAKRAEMCQPAAAERITGYVVGGISPFGQRRRLPTVVDEVCVLWDTIFVSGGRRGLDIEIAPPDLVRLLGATVAGIAAR